MSGGGHNISLRTWLRKVPQPVAVLADDKRIEVPRSGRPWHELEATIVALAPAKVTLLDGSGNILRSKDLSTETDPDDPGEPSAVGSDLQTLSKLLADAYEKGSKSYAPLISAAMEFVTRQSEQIARLEKECDRLRVHANKLQAELLVLSGQPAPEGEESILGALMAGIMQGQAAAQSAEPIPIKRGK